MEGWKHLEKGVVLYDPQKHNSHVLLYGYNLGVSCFARSATVLWLLGYPDQALKRSQQALTIAQQQPHPFSLAYALCFSAECHRLRREEQTTQERAEAAIRLSVEQGFPLWRAGATIYKGWALAEQGQYKEGISLMREGIATWQATGAEVARPAWLAQLAEGYGQAGQVAEGLSTITEGLNATNTREERWWEAELYRLQGELMLQQESQNAKVKTRKSKVPKHKAQSRGPQSEAEACFLKAIAIAQRQQAKSLELRATVSLARLWQRQEKLAEARQVLSKVYNWFTEGFDTTDLREAKALLDELRVNVVRDDLSAQTTH
jgi:predicted ATPase